MSKQLSKKELDARSRKMNPQDKSNKGPSKAHKASKGPKGKGNRNFRRPNTKFPAQVAPAAIGQFVHSAKARFFDVNGGVGIAHRELIARIQGDIAWDVQGLRIQPGLGGHSGCFSWLSAIAINFEQYRIRKLKFIWVTSCGSGTPGNVWMVPEFDPLDPAPLGGFQASNTGRAVSMVPWTTDEIKAVCSIPPASLHPNGERKLVTNATVATIKGSGNALMNYDAGNIFLATELAAADNTPWGDWYVEYEVEFYEPQGVPAIGPLFTALVSSPYTTTMANLLTLLFQRAPADSGMGSITTGGFGPFTDYSLGLQTIVIGGLTIGANYALNTIAGLAVGQAWGATGASLMVGGILNSDTIAINSGVRAQMLHSTFVATSTIATMTYAMSTVSGNFVSAFLEVMLSPISIAAAMINPGPQDPVPAGVYATHLLALLVATRHHTERCIRRTLSALLIREYEEVLHEMLRRGPIDTRRFPPIDILMTPPDRFLH